MARTRRRGWKIRTIGTTVLATLALCATAQAAPGDATHIYIDAGASSSQPSGGPTGTLRQAWSFQAGDSTSGALIVGGRVFTQDGMSVYALDAATGRRLWARRLTGIGGIVYAHGHVVVGSGSASAIVALDPATGATAWLTTVPFGRSMVENADDGHVVTGPGTPPYDGIETLDAATGAPLWSADTDLAGEPLILGDEVFIGPPGRSDSSSGVYHQEVDAYNLDSGAERVAARGSTDGYGALSAHDGLLYVNELLAGPAPGAVLDPATGARVGGPYLTSALPASDAHGLYMLLNDDYQDVHTLSAYDRAGAAARWTFSSPSTLRQTPLTAGGRVWIAGSDDDANAVLTGLDPVTGAVSQRLVVGDPEHGIVAPLAAGGGLLLVPTGDRLLALSGDGPVAGAPTGPAGPLTPPRLGADTGATGERQDAARSGTAPGAPAPPLLARWTVPGLDIEGTPLILGDDAVVAHEVRSGNAAHARLTAYALADGAVRWDVQLDGDGGDARPVGWRLAADGGHVYALHSYGGLVAFDARTGHELWRNADATSYDAVQFAPPIALGGLIYAVDRQSATAYDGTTGAVTWQHNLGSVSTHTSDSWAPPAADADHLYVVAAGATQDEECALTALDRRTGAVVWSVSRHCWRWDGISVAGGRVAFDGLVFDAATGRVLDTAAAVEHGALTPGLMVAQGVADQSDSDTNDTGLLSARAPGGPDVWEVRGASSPLLTGPFLYTAIAERLTALRTADGSVAWQGPAPAGAVEPTLDHAPRLAAATGVLLSAPEEGGLVAWAHDAGGAAIDPRPLPTDPWVVVGGDSTGTEDPGDPPSGDSSAPGAPDTPASATTPAPTTPPPPASPLAPRAPAPAPVLGASAAPTPTTTRTPRLTLAGATVRRRGATALAVTLRVPAAARLTLRISRAGTTIGTARTTVRRAGTIHLTVRLTAAGRRALRGRRALQVSLSLRLGTAVASQVVRVG